MRTQRVLLVITLLVVGCGGGAYRVHPGAGGYTTGIATPIQTDLSRAYDTLSATDAVIQQTRADFLANKFPAAAMPKIRTAFNALVGSYDTAQQSWLALNTSVASGGSVSEAALTAAIAAVNQALTSLASAKAGS